MRRGRGEGTITQRRDGRWMGRVDLGERDEITGKRRRKTVYGATRAACGQAMNVLLGKKENNELLTTTTPTLAQWAEEWYQTQIDAAEWTPGTQQLYRGLIDNHIVPALGTLRLEKIPVRKLQTFLRECGPRPVTTHLRCLLSQMFKFAMQQRLMTYNPAALTVQPRTGGARGKRVTRAIKRLTVDEGAALIDQAKGHPLGAAIIIMITMGLRLGEVLGVAWRNIDWTGGLLTVDQQVQSYRKHHGGLQVLSHLKTESSVRTLRMPALVIAMLKLRQRAQKEDRLRAGGDWRNPHDLVFTASVLDRRGHVRHAQNKRGNPVQPNVLRRALRDLTGSGHVHRLRHTAATLLLEDGTPLHEVSWILGHSELSTTADIYAEFTPKMKAEAATRMDTIFRGK